MLKNVTIGSLAIRPQPVLQDEQRADLPAALIGSSAAAPRHADHQLEECAADPHSNDAVDLASRGESPMRPFFGFYGGKWRDALKHYPPPSHKVIVEPFAGSAGYSVRHYDHQIILGEKDPVIFGVWDYMIKTSAQEILAIPDLQEGQSVGDLDICQEARWLVGFWLNRAAARPRTGPSAWMRQGLRPGSFWGDRVRNTIASQVDRIRHWKVFNCSYEEIPWSGEATWFIDPPYQKQGRHYHHGANDLDFAALGSWSREQRGQVIVCEQDGADWLPFRTLASIKTTRAKVRSHEVVWIKGESSASGTRKQGLALP